MIDSRYAKALGAAEATIAYVKGVLNLPPTIYEQTTIDRRERMLTAIENGQARIAHYLEEKADG